MSRQVLRVSLFPLVLTAGMIATLVGVRAGVSPTLVVMATIFASAVPILIAQVVAPFEDAWQGRPGDFGIDLLHMGSTALATEGYRALTVGLFTAAALWLQGTVGASLWPENGPWVFQLGLALLIGDFGAYWVHRGCHRSALLWRVHAMHHSSERLYVFASARNHPMNAILAYGSQLLPLTLLGAPLETIALVSVFTGIHGMLQHANIDLVHGPLNWVFSTADLHRWHHSTDMAESNTNFGSNLIVWDVVFGTRMLPVGRPAEVGLEGVALPNNFLAHLASPFVLPRWEQEPVKAK